MDRLPIDPLVPDVVRQLREAGRLVLEAPPGAGKTTRVPPAIADGLPQGEQVLVLEPRRLAARLAAGRVAAERGTRLGEEVGYQVRFDRKVGPRTRVVYLTEALLVRRLLTDPRLEGVGAVVLDEFHERSLHTDLALALLERLRGETRPDLQLLVTSATLDGERVAAALGDAPRLRSEGRLHPVTTEFHEQPDDRPLEVQVRAAVQRVLRDGADGDLLVFLPGAREIRRAREALAELAADRDLELLALHGELPAKDQDRALRPSKRRKVILSTNVAESSVTIEGVAVVVDSGLARRAGHSPWSGLSTLQTRPICRASAVQRAGRAGRLGPGRCLRLYTRGDFERRPEHETPELLRADLAETCLLLAALGVAEPSELAWLDPPPDAALDAARALLSRLDAIDPGGTLTEAGRALLDWPLHPRLGRLLLEADREGAFDGGCTLAALLGERDIVRRGIEGRRRADKSGPSDLLDRLDRFREAERAGFDRGALSRMGLDGGAVRRVDRVRRQLARRRRSSAPSSGGTSEDEALQRAALAGYPDRVAARRAGGEDEVVLAGGGHLRLSPQSVVRDAPFMVVVEATAGTGRGSDHAHLVSAIEPDWLLDLFPDDIEEGVEVEWNPSARRVEAFSRMRLGRVVLAETRASAAGEPAAAALLFDQARRAGLAAVSDPARLETLAGRLRVAREAAPDAGFPELDPSDPDALLERLCEGRTSFAELKKADPAEAVLGGLDYALRRELDRLAPTHIALPGRRRAPVSYPAGAPAFVASRLQDFFGLTETPRIGGGRVVLQCQLLAPNRRPVQITQDLPGFWTRHYPEVRRELRRRYPKHDWPERPPGAG